MAGKTKTDAGPSDAEDAAKAADAAEQDRNNLNARVIALESENEALKQEIAKLQSVGIQDDGAELASWKLRYQNSKVKREAWDKLVKSFKSIGLTIPKDLE